MWRRVYDGTLKVDLASPVGPLANNVYLLVGPSGSAIAVDPAIGARPILAAALRAQAWRLDVILATHSHFDHVADAGPLAMASGAPIAAHRLAAPPMAHPAQAMPFPDLALPPLSPAPVTRELEDGDLVAVDGLAFQVLHTPGHDPGSICLYQPDAALLLSGDTLFAGSFGRYDLPGGDLQRLRQSLRRLAALPPETRVLPGHGQVTTIGAEGWLRHV